MLFYLKTSSILMLSLIFGSIIYNYSLDDLEQLFISKDDHFLEAQKELSKNTYFEKGVDKHTLNQVTYRLNNFSITDTTNLRTIDSLINKITFCDSITHSVYQNQDGYLYFIKSFNSDLLSKAGTLTENKLATIKTAYLKFELALKHNPNNKFARHNYILLKSFFESKDFNFKKAQELSQLIFTQLKRDLLLDTTAQKKYAQQAFLDSKKKEIDLIQDQEFQEKCRLELKDTLHNTIDSLMLTSYHKKTLDSLKKYETLEHFFINELEKDKSKNDIISHFYPKEYQKIFEKSSIENMKKVLNDKQTIKKINQIICKYSPSSCDQNEDKKNKTKQKDDQSSNKSKDYKNPETKKEQTQQQHAQEMSDKLKDYEENRKKESDSKQQSIENTKEQRQQQQQPNKSSSNLNEQKLDKYNITPEQAKKALEEMQKQNENYYRSQKRLGKEKTRDQNKPNW